MNIASLARRVNEIKVAGVTQYASQVASVREGETVCLNPEPSNQFDSNAIAVITRSGERIGYIPRGLAAALSREGVPSIMTAIVTRAFRPDGATVGVRLRVDRVLSFAG
jgi:hypothetical protein